MSASLSLSRLEVASSRIRIRGIGEDGARDRHALALAARQLHAALADDGVVAVLERLDELVGVRDAADPLDLVERRVGLAVADVLGDGAVEQEVVLQHDAELLAVVAQPQLDRSWPSTRIRPLSGRLNAITRLISVLLPDPLDPTSAVVVPAGARKLTFLSTGVPGLYSKLTSSNTTSPRDLAERRLARVLLVLGRHLHQLADAIEPGERLADLRADRRHLDDRRRQQAGEEDVVEEVADRHLARPGSTRPPTMIMMTPMIPMIAVENAVIAETPVIDLRDVAEQPVGALGEDQLLALLGGVGLDDADAAERFVEAAGDLGVDLAALAEERPQPLERGRHRERRTRRARRCSTSVSIQFR